MAIAFVNAADLGNSNTDLTASYTVGSGTDRLLIVCFAADFVEDLTTTVTYNGVSMTLAGKYGPPTSPTYTDRWVYVYYLLNPDSGANNVVVTASGGFILAIAADYTGVNQTGQPDAIFLDDAGNGASTSSTITTIADNCWVIMGGYGYTGATATGNDTLRTVGVQFGTPYLFDSNGLVTPAGNFTMQTSGATFGIALILVSFAPTSATNTLTGQSVICL